MLIKVTSVNLKDPDYLQRFYNRNYVLRNNDDVRKYYHN